MRAFRSQSVIPRARLRRRPFWNVMSRGTRSATRRGASAVEMAFVLPIFFIVILGIVEFGRAFMVQHLLSNAARVGVRKAIVDGSTTSGIEEAVRDLCQQSVGVGGESFSIDVAGGEAGYLAETNSGETCTVSISVPFDCISFIPGSYLSGLSLSASCSMEHE